MSRSYRKHPILKVICSDGKKFANRKVRRTKEDISNGNEYRKIYSQWDVCDQWYRTTLQEEITYWYRRQAIDYPKVNWGRWVERTLEEQIIEWKKMYYWK